MSRLVCSMSWNGIGRGSIFGERRKKNSLVVNIKQQLFHMKDPDGGGPAQS